VRFLQTLPSTEAAAVSLRSGLFRLVQPPAAVRTPGRLAARVLHELQTIAPLGGLTLGYPSAPKAGEIVMIPEWSYRITATRALVAS
jgi:hypothetical protein